MKEAAYRKALQEVRARVAASRTSFGAGMAVLPRERREAMYALYAFCREVDDIADDGANEEMRRRGLRLWRQRLHDLFHVGQPSECITRVLYPALNRFALVESEFQAIIDGMEMDAGAPLRAPSLATLDLYCDRVASAVGRVSVRIFGDASAEAMKVAHHLGRALQLTNILRDVAEDAARGRLYLPEELLIKHNLETQDPIGVLGDRHFASLCRELAAMAGEHFQQADAAIALCDSKSMRPARIMRAYYGAIHAQLVKEDWRDPFTRVSLSTWQKLRLALSNMVG
ncbi:MAG: presqualene diphosphate synthase HpnD [Alphaproteobacteria bacterium]|nr:presqualene diphosphate synthase HpnD [Alphaproteobacteria bacterium]